MAGTSALGLVGLFRPPTPGQTRLRRLYFITLAQFGIFVVTWIVNYFVLEDEWSLYSDQPILWVLQLLAVLEAWHISGFDDENPQESRKLLVSLFLATLNWVLAFVYVIEETADCNKIESTDLANMQKCYDMVSSSVSATQGLVCQADVDIGSRATGVCPQVRFGEGGGTVWIIWQFILVLFFIGTNLVAFYTAAMFQERREADLIQRMQSQRSAAQKMAYTRAPSSVAVGPPPKSSARPPAARPSNARPVAFSFGA
jgi:hypothetical protein